MEYKNHSRYFYEGLNDAERSAYDALLHGWLNYQQDVTLAGFTDTDAIEHIIWCVYKDNPELFYVNFDKFSIRTTSKTSVVAAKMLYSEDESREIEAQIDEVVERVRELCDGSDDKERVIHDYLVNTVTYSKNMTEPRIFDIRGALLDGDAVCEGFARAFKLLCDAMRIKCIVVSGVATNSDGKTERHSWNIIRKNRKNYHVDVTWNRAMNAADGVPLYYNVPDDYISRNHVWDREKWPACTDFSEIKRYNSYVTGKKSLGIALDNGIREKKPSVAMTFNRKFSSAEALNEVIGEVVIENKLRVRTYASAYYPELDSAVVWLTY